MTINPEESQPLKLADFEIKPTPVDPELIRRFTSEDQFMELAVELLKEACTISTLAAGTHPLDENFKPRAWQRNEAILCGLMVRIVKLILGILDATCQRRREIADILFRCFSETIINMCYLLYRNEQSIFEEYLEYSLRKEKSLLNSINKKIAERGHELPIETRMKRSIEQSFIAAGIDPQEVNEADRDPWGASIHGRAKEIGLGYAYFALFQLPSHAIHGNWEDLITHHVLYENEGFTPKPEWSTPRPQPIFLIASLSIQTAVQYIDHFVPECDDKTKVKRLIEDLLNRLSVSDQLHEEFMQRD